MIESLKNYLYRLKRNNQKTKELIDQSKLLSRAVNQENVTFSEAFQAVNKYEAFQPSQIESEIEYLFEIVKTDQPKVICEIGSYKGGTLFLFSQAAPSDALIISIDIQYPIARKLSHKHLVKKGQKLVCIEGDTQDPKTISRVTTVLNGRNIDFLFIDGDHSLFGVMNDYVRFSPLVKKSGVIAFHDINPDMFMKTGMKSAFYVGGVPIFWDFLTKSGAKFETVVEDFEQDGFGIGIVHKSVE